MRLKPMDGVQLSELQWNAEHILPRYWTRIMLGIIVTFSLVLCLLADGWLRTVLILFTLVLIGYGIIIERSLAASKHHTELDQDIHFWEKYMDKMPLPTLLMTRQGEIVILNAVFRDKSGFSAEQADPVVTTLFEERSVHALLSTLQQVTEDGMPKQVELTSYHSLGFRQDWHAGVIPSPFRQCVDSELIMVYMQDNSTSRHMAEKIHYMSYYDDMTGLPNRRMFIQKLEESINSARKEHFSIAVLYMDLDRFKRINDTFGSDFGDMLLMQIADRLLRSMTDNDFLARMDSDEFACFMSYTSTEEEVAGRVEQLLAVMQEPFVLDDIPVHVTLSIGVVSERIHIAPDDNVTLFMKRADAALAMVKQRGKNSYLFFSPDMDTPSLERITLEHEMLNGLQDGQFELYYQPQVELDTKQIVGVEALVRWNHPERGMVPPAEFIPLAEENGFIVPLGEWVIQEACRQNKQWQSEGLPHIPVSVNLSVRQFEQHDLIKVVEHALTVTGLKPQYLDLEITETMTMDVSRALRVMKDLKRMGVTISIDDFGTGYSSLLYLKNFPINRLKIDRSFVRDLEQDPNDAAIVSAIIAMGHKMNLQVIAEGVENKDQVEFLQEHACDELQGYYFSPPLPVNKIEAMLSTQVH
ncbi:putative bifunctional diguanylate cyclase/phosphodiesterase [Paenibacillus marinisediminis]